MFENLKLRTRFAILIIIILLANIIVYLLQFYSFQTAYKNFDDIYIQSVKEIQMLNDIRGLYIQNILDPAYQVQSGKMSTEQAIENIKETRSKIDEIWTEYNKNIREFEQFETNQNSAIENVNELKKEISPLIEQFIEALKEGDKDLITKLNQLNLPPIIHQILKSLRQLTVEHIEETHRDYDFAVKTLESLQAYMIVIFVIQMLLVTFLAIWLAFGITKTLKKATDILKKLTLGDLDFQVENTSKSELGQLLEAMNSLGASDKKMSMTLQSIAEGNLDIEVEIRSNKDILGISLMNMVQNLKNIIGNIQTEVNTLASSSQEIVRSVSQVATTTSETAAAVTETTTSVEELKQTAHMNAEKAQEVLGNSEETLHIVNASETLLQTTIEDMRQISEKMRIISEGIVKLSEHSQTIGEIIDTVNDLAEQSNLLAVNAAIEAAKAGEHGKGFVVVAQEIRSLAEQSKSSTIQVRGILNEIQNSTTKAVLATEEGAKAVEKGVAQSAQTSESMHKLSASVSHVTQAANQIAISSQQQFVGVDQVTAAINNISDAASELVDHIKQIDYAVSSLNSIGVNLKDMADQYTLKKDSNFISKNNKKIPLKIERV